LISRRLIATLATAAVLVACASPNRNGMVLDAGSGVQYGSSVEKNIFLDSSQFPDKRVKVTSRNVSGDVSYQITDFEADISAALAKRGYAPANGENFGLRFDINVLYSGQIQKNMSSEFAFLGGAGGAVAGYRADGRGSTAGGALAGAALGGLIGSAVTDDTYIVVAEVSIGVNSAASTERTVITLGSSPPLQRQTTAGLVPFREVLRTKVAVYAGGRNLGQQAVVRELRRRLLDIASNTL
jgi:hypothetical protein